MPWDGSLALTALVAMLPLLTLFVLLGVARMTPWKAALVSLVVSLVVAVFAYSMPAGQAFNAGLEGAAFGFFPILWIVINAIWVYKMTVQTGPPCLHLRTVVAGTPALQVLTGLQGTVNRFTCQ
jgi:lactate permease